MSFLGEECSSRTRFVPRSLDRYIELYLSENRKPILIPFNPWKPKPETLPVGRGIGTIDLWKHKMEHVGKLFAVPIRELKEWAKSNVLDE